MKQLKKYPLADAYDLYLLALKLRLNELKIKNQYYKNRRTIYIQHSKNVTLEASISEKWADTGHIIIILKVDFNELFDGWWKIVDSFNVPIKLVHDPGLDPKPAVKRIVKIVNETKPLDELVCQIVKDHEKFVSESHGKIEQWTKSSQLKL